jgi:O-antigen/teichoic acid export membrane protein
MEALRSKLLGFAKDSAIYGIGEVLGKAANLILIPILSRLFLPSDYGIIDLLTISLSFLIIIISLNMYTGLQKFFYSVHGDERKNLLSSTLLCRLIISTITSMIIVFAASEISVFAFQSKEYSKVIFIVALILPFQDIYDGLMLILRLKRQSVVFCTFNIVQVVALPILTYFFVSIMGLSLAGVFIAKLVVLNILVLALLFTLIKDFSFSFKIVTVVDLIRYSLPGLPAILIANMMTILPRYFLVMFSTLSDVGLFGMADRFARVIDMFKSAFNRAWNPFAFSNSGKEDEKLLYEKVFKIFAICLISLGILITLFSKEILFYLTPNQYHNAASMIGGLCIYYILSSLTIIYSTGLYSVNRVFKTSFLSGIQISFFCILSIFFIPAYGLNALIIILPAASFFYLICYYIVVKRYFPFNNSWYRLILISVIGLIVCGIPTFLSGKKFMNLNSEHIKILFFLVYIFTASFIITLKNERKYFYNAIKKSFFIPSE